VSSDRRELTVELPRLEASRLVRKTFEELGWSIARESGETEIVAKEPWRTLFRNSYPVQARVVLQRDRFDRTVLVVIVSNMGIGPWQSGYVNQQLARVCVELTRAAHGWRTTSVNESTSTIADELQKLTELHKTGALTDEEFQIAKARLLRG
jgi:hypothetical protein